MSLKEFNFLRAVTIFAILAGFIVCLIMVPITANASGSETFWTDVMQYGGLLSHYYSGEDHVFSDSYGTGFYFAPRPGHNEVKLAMSTFSSVDYVDMVIDVGNGLHNDLIIKAFDCDLNVIRYGQYNNIWRLYGVIDTYYAQYETFNITIENSGDHNHYFSILQCRFSSTVPYTDVSGTWDLTSNYATDSGSFPTGITATDWSTPVNATGSAGEFILSIPGSQWMRYSHIDLQLIFHGPQVNNISSSIGNSSGYIPMEFSFIDDTDYEYFHLINLSLDLSNLQASNTPLTIYFGFQEYLGVVNQIYIVSCHGWNVTPALSDTSYWGSVIAGILKEELGNLSTGTITDEQQSVIDGALAENEKLSDTIDSLGAINTPDLDQFGTPIDFIEDINFNSNLSHLFVVTSAQPYRTMLFIAALFTLIGVILHGRRQ